MMDGEVDLGGGRRRWQQITGINGAQPFISELKDICCQQVPSAFIITGETHPCFPGMTI